MAETQAEEDLLQTHSDKMAGKIDERLYVVPPHPWRAEEWLGRGAD